MPDRLISDPSIKEAAAIVVTLLVGYVARSLVSDEPFRLRKFIGEMLISCMMGAAIYAFGVIQDMGFWQTLLIALLSGMGATRSIEWMVKASRGGANGG